MCEPKVSVLMPVYGAQEFIAEAVMSCQMALNHIDLELLVIQTGQRGYAETFNRLLDAARGEYIARLDADDSQHALRLKKQVAYLESHPECDIVTCGRLDMDADGFLSSSPSGPMVPEEFLTGKGHGPTSPTIVCHRDVYTLVGEFDDTVFPSADSDWTVRALLAGCTFGHVDEPLYYYRRHPGQVSVTHEAEMKEAWRGILRKYDAGIKRFLAARAGNG